VRFTVVIPTRGRPEHASACVRAILAQESPPPFEVVVADQSDDEATREAVGADPRVRVERVPGRGRSRALNAGFRAASAPWIVVTDDDCRPAPDWLAALARVIPTSAAAATPPTAPTTRPAVPNAPSALPSGPS